MRFTGFRQLCSAMCFLALSIMIIVVGGQKAQAENAAKGAENNQMRVMFVSGFNDKNLSSFYKAVDQIDKEDFIKFYPNKSVGTDQLDALVYAISGWDEYKYIDQFKEMPALDNEIKSIIHKNPIKVNYTLENIIEGQPPRPFYVMIFVWENVEDSRLGCLAYDLVAELETIRFGKKINGKWCWREKK